LSIKSLAKAGNNIYTLFFAQNDYSDLLLTAKLHNTSTKTIFRKDTQNRKRVSFMENQQGQNESMTVGTAKASSNKKGKKRTREITAICVNELPDGILEEALAEIYARKIRNGTLIIE